jgi:hypothetical protein
MRVGVTGTTASDLKIRPIPLTDARSTEASMQGNIATQGGRPETVGLITLSYRGDLERCALLFESIDRHLPGRGQHYVIVDDQDVEHFARFRTSDRQILPKSRFLPRWLRPVPLLRWRRRRYWWSLHGKPVSGWHVQQFVKIAAARSLREQRFCLIDSDVCFFRDFDLRAVAEPNPTPLHIHPKGVTVQRPRHMLWVATASRLLDQKEPELPTDDYIDQIIIWDQATVQAMIARIEAVTGRGWVEALCQHRNFSEYMIYGAFVANTPSALASHRPTTQSFCRTHWDADALSVPDMLALLRSSSDAERALCIQSFGSTPVSAVRTSLELFYSARHREIKETEPEAA